MSTETQAKTWSPQQESAMDAVSQWLRGGDQQTFRLYGYAGTGKTTLARSFAADVAGDDVVFGAFTGKAAHVLRQKGCHGATTIHSLIYKPVDRSKGFLVKMQQELDELIQELVHVDEMTKEKAEDHPQVKKLRKQIHDEKLNLKRPRFSLNINSDIRDASLVIIDECSMVDEEMGRDLESFDAPILVLGDPAQLPPVGGDGYFTKSDPDFMLTEIHRQAEKSPIIDLATKARERRIIGYGSYGSSSVIDWSSVDNELAMKVDQIIVGTNKMRRQVNDRVRHHLGRGSPLPEPTDRLVCLRNDHDVGLLNGSIWVVEDIVEADDEVMSLVITSEDGSSTITCEAHTHHFLGKELPYWDRKQAQEFDFGYALTCHKSQGSQWDRVLVFDESRKFREHKHRWLYTAVTRAAEEVIIAR